MVFRRKRQYPATVDEYVRLATRAGWRPPTIENGRRHLLQYHRWLGQRFRMDVLEAGAEEFIRYRKSLLVRPISKTSVARALSDIARFYLLKAQNGDGVRWLNLYNQLRALCRVGGHSSAGQSYKPFSHETLQRILAAAQSYHRYRRWNTWVDCEDYEIVMTLLYTGGRAQFYGLRVDQIDFEKGEIHTPTKGGAPASIPLHPTLAAVLRRHLRTRKYHSDHLFQYGRGSDDWKGINANKGNAWKACKRVQAAAGLTESVHPHRFRKTLAVMGRQLGLDVAQVQGILGHRHVQTTFDTYATPDLDELKLAFASIDLTPEANGRSGTSSALRPLRGPPPPGTEHGMNLIATGLQCLFADGRAPPGPRFLARRASATACRRLRQPGTEASR
jgi:integrase